MDRICEICGKSEGKIINSKKFGKMLCNKHWIQLQQHKKIINRTMYDKNEYLISENICYIFIYYKNGDIKTKAIIDVENIDLCKNYKWTASNDGHVYTNAKIKYKSLHRLLMNPEGNLQVDHINCNPLDNRKENLRVCLKIENDRNKPLRNTNKSGITGVRQMSLSSWEARIMVNKKSYTKRFKTKEEATKQRKEWEQKYFGEFAYKGD